MIINFDPLKTEPVQAMCWLVEGIYNYLKNIILPWGVLSFVRIKFLIFSLTFFLLPMAFIPSEDTFFFFYILQGEIGTFVSNISS